MSKIIASTYEISEKIGSGGGGVIYLAEHLRLGKRVILKADKRKITTRSDLLRREVDILKNLSHPYIPQVYDFFVENETVYTVMDYIEGESLDKPLKRGEKYSQPLVIKWACQLLEALCYLHSPTHGTPPRGYVHSDIKPANLMRTPGNNICLIDFNIALALGEENVVGCSAGYASPEHYGLDFLSEEETRTKKTASADRIRTRWMQQSPDGVTLTMPGNFASGTVRMKRKIPDVRSDIYSVGATLYHLLSGTRPARNAKEVVPLSKGQFSTQIVDIITKAMDPDPDRRYQTAADMLEAFCHLHEKDPRMLRFQQSVRRNMILLSVFLLTGVIVSFTGLKRMQAAERFYKLAEYSQSARSKGGLDTAVDYALQAISQKRGLFTPKYPAEVQKALTDALGVYDLSDGYKAYKTIELPSEPLYMSLAPDGMTACVIYAYAAGILNLETGESMAALPAEDSALSESVFLDDHTLIYAGKGALRVCDTLTGDILWEGNPSTSICVSGDGKRVAAVYKDEKFATIYDAVNGNIVYTVDFDGKHQQVTANDRFANPDDNLLALNYEGTLLGASFSDGSLMIYDLEHPKNDMELLNGISGYSHFEGGFHGTYFAFSASSVSGSAFAVIDTENAVQTGGFESEGFYSVQADDSGIYVQTENLLVRIHPETGEQTPLVETPENIKSYAMSREHTLITSEEEILFFDRQAGLISHHEKEYKSEMVGLAGGTALIGSSDSPVVWIMKYENHPETELLHYDSLYEHDEARMSADKQTVMLFSCNGFRLIDTDGKLVAEKEIPDAEQVYDQQYIRDKEDSRLEVIYNDGTVTAYNARDGSLMYEKIVEKPDQTLQEEFLTDTLRIESPLHGTPTAYEIKSGRLVQELDPDNFLTYVTQVGKYIIAQYITAEGYCYGQLLNEECKVLAELPYLCDVLEDRLIFDYPTGDLRESHIYEIEELVETAEERMNGGE